MKRKNNNLHERHVSIETMKSDAVALASDMGNSNNRDRCVRGMTLINQLLKYHRIDSAGLEIHNMNVEYAAKPLKDKDRTDPVFKMKFKEKRCKLKEKTRIEDVYGDYDHTEVTITSYTESSVRMTLIVPDADGNWSTKVTLEAACRLPGVGFVYSQLVRKILYIYACSYIMKSRNFIDLEGLELHTPYGDIFRDTANTVKYKEAA